MSQEPVNLSGPDSEAWQRSLPEGSRFVVANDDLGGFSVWQQARALSEDDYVRLVALYALDPGEAGVQAKCFVVTGEWV